MPFNTEFPTFPASDYPALPAGFIDSSWHNDSCPSMKNEALRLLVFVDFADESARDFDGFDQFIVLALDEDGSVEEVPPLLTTDDWSEVEAFIAKRRAEVSP